MAEKESRGKSALSDEKPKPAAKPKKAAAKKSAKKATSEKRKLRAMHISHADNPDGGYIATHDFESPEGPEGMGKPAPPSEDHIINDMPGLQDHVGEHMAQPAPAPAPAPSGPMPPQSGVPGMMG